MLQTLIITTVFHFVRVKRKTIISTVKTIHYYATKNHRPNTIDPRFPGSPGDGKISRHIEKSKSTVKQILIFIILQIMYQFRGSQLGMVNRNWKRGKKAGLLYDDRRIRKSELIGWNICRGHQPTFIVLKIYLQTLNVPIFHSLKITNNSLVITGSVRIMEDF